MKKRNLLIIVLGVITTLKLSAYDFVFVNGGYIGDLGWKYTNGAVLNGKKFYSVADSYREQQGFFDTIIGMKVDCWLYDTYTYHNGDGSEIYNKYIPEFFKSCGHYIVWEKETFYDVPDVVKALMKQRNCDVAIYLMLGWGYVANYDKSKNRYWLDMFKPVSFY